MQFSPRSTTDSSHARSRDEAPKGKRAQAIKWTQQEWAQIAASIYLTDATLLEGAGLEKIKARHIFEAQQSCLPRIRQRQLISIAQDFTNKRDHILQTMLQMRSGRSLSGITLRPAFGFRDRTSTSCGEVAAADANGTAATGEIAGSTAEQSRLRSRNGLVMLPHSGSDAVTWAPEEWAAVARALLDESPAIRDGKGEDGLDAQSIYTAQQALPELRRRDLPSIQARLVDDCARLRNILDVMRANTPTTMATAAAERRPQGSIFRADSSGNGFTRFTPKSLSEAYPGHRIVTAEDTMQLSGVRRKGPSFKLPFPVEVEAPTVRRPEVEEAIAELFGSSTEVPASPPSAEVTTQAAEPTGDESSASSSGSPKRPFIRWNENEWRQLAQNLIAQSGGKTDPEKQGFITPLAVHAAQSCLLEERRRTVGSVYSGFASTKEKLAGIVRELAADGQASTPEVSADRLIAQASAVASVTMSTDSVQGEEVSVPAAHHNEPGVEAMAVAQSSHQLASSSIYEASLVEAIQPARDPSTITEMARPFVRMMCEEFWDSIARHVLPPVAAYFTEKK